MSKSTEYTAACPIVLLLALISSSTIAVAAQTAVKPGKAAPVQPHVISPEARTALARLKSTLENAPELDYESIIALKSSPSPQGAGDNETLRIKATLRKPNLIFLETTVGQIPSVQVIVGPESGYVYDSAAKRYGKFDTPKDIKTTLTTAFLLAIQMQDAASTISLRRTIGSFLIGNAFDVTSTASPQTALTVTASPDVVSGQAVTHISQTMSLNGVTNRVHVLIAKSTGLPLQLYQTSAFQGRETSRITETFTSFALPSTPSPADRFQFTPPADASVFAPPTQAAASDPLQNGSLAPDFEVTDMSGKKVRLSSSLGKVVVLDFWAQKHGPSLQSMPATDSIARAYQAKGVVFLPISRLDEKAEFTEWIKGKPAMTMHFYFDPSEAGKSIGGDQYLVNVLPAQFVIGRDGKIVACMLGYDGADTSKALKKAIDSALSPKRTTSPTAAQPTAPK